MSTLAPVERSIATLQSRSQLEPGKTMTAAFMGARLALFVGEVLSPERRRREERERVGRGLARRLGGSSRTHGA
jgi:hypothetical protein